MLLSVMHWECTHADTHLNILTNTASVSANAFTIYFTGVQEAEVQKKLG